MLRKPDLRTVLLDIIETIERNKIEQHKAPVQATTLEINEELSLRVKAELNNLVGEKKLDFGKTLNSIYFKTKIK
jgi:hypothetical protein